MPNIIIGMSGKRGVGKTTAANYLVQNYRFKKVSFAEKLKETAKLMFPFTDYDFSTAAKEKPYKNYPWTVREFLINLGAFARFHDSDYWVKAVGLDKMAGRIVIDDVRFPNEVEILKGLGAKIVRLERYPKLNVYGPTELDDPSETSLDDYKGFDFSIHSCYNTTMEELKTQMDRLVRDIT